jgi:hypothetical protein
MGRSYLPFSCQVLSIWLGFGVVKVEVEVGVEVEVAVWILRMGSSFVWISV